jgi:hypothetical protein
MARVNFEEHGFADGRLGRLAKAIGSNIQEAAGLLVFLWRDSQEELRFTGTKEEIIEWCRPESEEEGERYFNALVKTKYLVAVGGEMEADQWEIRGNKPQIESRIFNLKRAKKGGRSLHDKIKRLKNENKNNMMALGLKHASVAPEAGFVSAASLPSQYNTIQGNTDQIRSIQDKADQEGEEGRQEDFDLGDSRPAPPPAPCLMTLWNSNASGLIQMKAAGDKRKEAWRRRWKEKPDLPYWVDVVKRLSSSSFCRGENDRGWKADVDFFLKPDTHIKALEGKYDRGPIQRRQTHAEAVSAHNEALMAKVVAEEEAANG